MVIFQFKTPYECIAEGTKQELRQTPDSVEQLKTLLKSAKSPVADEVLKEIGVSLGSRITLIILLRCFLGVSNSNVSCLTIS